jgi:hypothetical protein
VVTAILKTREARRAGIAISRNQECRTLGAPN